MANTNGFDSADDEISISPGDGLFEDRRFAQTGDAAFSVAPAALLCYGSTIFAAQAFIPWRDGGARWWDRITSCDLEAK